MSKMSQLHAELTEQAARLGFQDLGEAEQAGYGVDWENHRLIKLEDEQDKAHEAWLKERDEVLEGLNEMWVGAVQGGYEQKILERAIDFVKKGGV